jgi:hypothetical protein
MSTCAGLLLVQDESLPTSSEADPSLRGELGIGREKFTKCPAFSLLIGSIETVPVVEEEDGSVLHQARQEPQDRYGRLIKITIHEGNPDLSGCEGALELRG